MGTTTALKNCLATERPQALTVYPVLKTKFVVQATKLSHKKLVVQKIANRQKLAQWLRTLFESKLNLREFEN